MVFVGVRKEHRPDAPLAQVREVREHEIDPQMLVAGERKTGVDDHQLVAELVHREVLPDLSEAATVGMEEGARTIVGIQRLVATMDKVVVTKNLRSGGELNDLAGETVALCQQAGLLYWQHVIALHAAIRDSQLVPRPSFWQLSTTRNALARGEHVQLVCHEDVLVFRKPDTAVAATTRRRQQNKTRRAA